MPHKRKRRIIVRKGKPVEQDEKTTRLEMRSSKRFLDLMSKVARKSGDGNRAALLRRLVNEEAMRLGIDPDA